MSHLDKADPILDFQLGRSVVPLVRIRNGQRK